MEREVDYNSAVMYTDGCNHTFGPYRVVALHKGLVVLKTDNASVIHCYPKSCEVIGHYEKRYRLYVFFPYWKFIPLQNS